MDYMQRALSLANLALGHTSPNPAVGAVIVKEGMIVGEGYTQPPGSDHAEVVALRQAGEKARGATMYVNLEPCCTYGRTPPCTQDIINAGIIEVHFSMIDPTPLVCGRGASELEAAGVKTFLGEHAEEALEINEAYFKFITKGLPFVIAKYAMSLDGRIATKTGDSKWISSEESGRYVHCLRHGVDAIMVGVNTILADDPQLTARAGRDGGLTEKQPLRVVVDSKGRTPPTARVLQMPGKTIIAVARDEIEPDKARALTQAGAEVLMLSSKDELVDLGELFRALGKMQVISLLVEGGAILFSSLFEEDLVDKLLVFVGPIIIGGGEAKSPIEGKGVEKIAQAMTLSRVRAQELGNDVLITGYVRKI